MLYTVRRRRRYGVKMRSDMTRGEKNKNENDDRVRRRARGGGGGSTVARCAGRRRIIIKFARVKFIASFPRGRCRWETWSRGVGGTGPGECTAAAVEDDRARIRNDVFGSDDGRAGVPGAVGEGCESDGRGR